MVGNGLPLYLSIVSISRSSCSRVSGALEPPHPRALAVLVVPGADGVGELVQLHAAVALARPGVRERLAELGVPEQRRHVVERDHHADVVDRAVGHGLDRAVGERAPAEQPESPVDAVAMASSKGSDETFTAGNLREP